MATLAKPGSVATILVGGKIGTVSTDEFILKMLSADMMYTTKTIETTGDADDANEPVWENSGILYGKWILRGGMISGQALGLANLVNTSTNPQASVAFHWGGSRKVTVDKLQIESINIAWRKSAPYVGVSMIANISNTITEGAVT